ncbi:HAD family hydrolase [Halobacillus sp. K22]|uniref:HAD family hydrolase n=1 Tax=Halobacillus sp. K22 TaxID=3457431 RepID=UPI003FCD146B
MDSIIFDLDGTLWDPIDTVVEAWNEQLKDYPEVKQLTREDFEGVMGLQTDEIKEKLFSDLNEEKRDHILTRCFEAEQKFIRKQGGNLFPHVEEVLERLSVNYRLFIVSNCQDGYIESFYDYYKLEKYFSDYEHPGRTGLSKGENIKFLMERNELRAPVYVGDTQGDERASDHAGIPFVFAAYGFGNVEKWDWSIKEFKDLLNLF